MIVTFLGSYSLFGNVFLVNKNKNLSESGYPGLKDTQDKGILLLGVYTFTPLSPVSLVLLL
jgi:hypothetical protein